MTTNAPATSRTVDPTGLIWQDGTHGEKIIGEVHRTTAGRFFVIIGGDRVLGTNARGHRVTVATFAEAERAALDFVPTGAAAAAVAHVLDPMGGTFHTAAVTRSAGRSDAPATYSVLYGARSRAVVTGEFVTITATDLVLRVRTREERIPLDLIRSATPHAA